MPNIKSAKKRVKIGEVRALRNKMVKSALRTSIKKADTAITSAAQDKDVSFKAAIVTIDKAVAKGILSKNTAARRKSQLATKLNKANA
ncbi:MAG: 30S ribosomal protein S20 [Clostridia bacterium]|nr:30S ribosomal protein S20 [Clostridia bacterium]